MMQQPLGAGPRTNPDQTTNPVWPRSLSPLNEIAPPPERTGTVAANHVVIRPIYMNRSTQYYRQTGTFVTNREVAIFVYMNTIMSTQCLRENTKSVNAMTYQALTLNWYMNRLRGRAHKTWFTRGERHVVEGVLWTHYAHFSWRTTNTITCTDSRTLKSHHTSYGYSNTCMCPSTAEFGRRVFDHRIPLHWKNHYTWGRNWRLQSHGRYDSSIQVLGGALHMLLYSISSVNTLPQTILLLTRFIITPSRKRIHNVYRWNKRDGTSWCHLTSRQIHSDRIGSYVSDVRRR